MKAKVLRFILPSFLGILLFMIPFSIDGEVTLPIAFLATQLQTLLGSFLPFLLLFFIFISAFGSLILRIFKPKWLFNHSYLKSLFETTPLWFAVRLIAFFLSTFFILELYAPQFLKNTFPFLQKLTSIVTSMNTGGLIFYELLPLLMVLFLCANIFLPLLLDFGLLNFMGGLLSRIMEPIFNLPGRAAIDCITSWLGDGTIGVLLTSKQYEDGFYTKREAAVIGTTFSLVSITFSLVVIDTVGLSHLFLPFYFTVTLSSLIAAILVPKLPPLSLKKDVFITNKPKTAREIIDYKACIQKGYQEALLQAQQSSIYHNVLKNGLKNALEMWIGVIPIILGIGTITLILATYTPLFKILGLPFLPLLKLLQIPEAVAASETLMAGFADMLLPSIIASATIKSEFTRFVVASVSVTQLIYLSEVGALLLGSKIPIRLGELFFIFLERTVITLPLIALMAHFIF